MIPGKPVLLMIHRPTVVPHINDLALLAISLG